MSSGTESEDKYEKEDIPLPYITNEVRYRMKNIPFFCIPPCESRAYDQSRVKAKVDTRNTSYVPSRPWSSEGSRASSSPSRPRWNASLLSKSFSDHSSSSFTPLYTRSTPAKGHNSPTKKEARENGGTEITGSMATISSPRRGSGGDRGDIKVAFKARKNPSLPDYSHVKSKIRTCWEPRDKNVGEVGVASEKSSNGSESGSPSTPRRSTEGAGMTPTRKKSVGSARFRITDYSHVTAKVDSIRKISSGSEEDISRGVAKKVRSKESGRDIEEVDGKLASPKSVRKLNLDGLGQRSGTGEPKSSPRRNIASGLGSGATPAKQGGWSKQISPAGTLNSPTRKMPTTYTVNSPRNRYANVKSKVDTSDPNPAHKLSRTISDLTIKEGRQINPRFANVRPERTGARSDIAGQTTPKDIRSFSRIKGERASGIKSPYTREKPTSELVSKEKMPSLRRGMGNQNSALKKREIRMPAVKKIAAQPADILREVESENLGAVVDKEVQNQSLNTQAFSEEPDVSIKEEEEESMEAESGIGISGIEVDNNETETTVVLKHILALSGRNDGADKSASPSSPISNGLVIVEEDELGEDYYESKDKVKSPSEIPSDYNLPHLIPMLIVTDEDKELVETVVSEARKLESTGTDLTGSSVGHKYTIATSKLQVFEEEEDEEDEGASSTHL